jgi:uncharacterized membrane protein YsdA (DUF1294 family)
MFFQKYLLIINVITFVVYGLDKLFAIKHKRRIRIITLLGLAFIGGELGGLLAMNIFHHKTSKKCFTIGLPLMLVMHMIIYFYIVLYV